MRATVKEHALTLDELLDWLLADGMVTAEQAELLRTLARAGGFQGKHPLTVVAQRNWRHAQQPQQLLDVEALGRWLAARFGLEYFQIDPLQVDVARVTEVMPFAYADRYKVLPVRVSDQEIVVATAEPFLREWERELAHVQRKSFRRVIADPEDISRYLVEFYAMAKSVFGAERQQGDRQRGGMQSLEQLMELGRAGKLDANDQHVVSVVDWLLQYAFEQRASDIHIEPRREMGKVRFRIDGVLHTVYQLPSTVMMPVTSRLKILGRMDIAEKRRPQDGRIKTRTPEGQEVEMRLSTMPTAFGEKLVMRIFDPDVLLRDFRDLGFESAEEQLWQEMTSQPHGIVLVTGPTGSGKTTTLYSTLKRLATPEVNVCTIEDPIELMEPSFNQMQVHAAIDLGFAEGVRTLLRQDPDIIMIGEIRDRETAEMAIQAALTGHLVLSTLHTNDAPSSLTRLRDLGVPGYLLHSSLLGITAQRLLRTLCPSCKRPAEISDTEWQALTRGWKVPKPEQVYAPGGCLECRNTGYRGRLGIYEMMRMTTALKEMIAAEAAMGELRLAAYKAGLKPLRLQGARKVAQGLTTVEEVLRVTPPPESSR
ncbi:MAG TPA: GspE/PulE family protein [Gammaproteobacteria bacterium]|nr:GspE/PulE family protein [Gammaproteobacteria bacterium]